MSVTGQLAGKRLLVTSMYSPRILVAGCIVISSVPSLVHFRHLPLYKVNKSTFREREMLRCLEYKRALDSHCRTSAESDDVTPPPAERDSEIIGPIVTG